jgi:hypothetical protein
VRAEHKTLEHKTSEHKSSDDITPELDKPISAGRD